MAKLTKITLITNIAADPGSPGSPGIAPSPSYSIKECETTQGDCFGVMTPVYGSCSPDSLIISPGVCVVAYVPETICEEVTTCITTLVPASAGVAAVPARPPSPAQLIQNFQEGWNASAQSIPSLLPGQAALFRIANGTRGILVGFATEPWVPKVNTLAYGIMFHDGKGDVYESGVFKEALGSFIHGQEFLLGRSLDNFIVYRNQTDGQTVARVKSPAAPDVPVHFFALLYRGGDTIFI